MPSFTTTALFASLALTSLVAAAPVNSRGQPAGWATGYLEDYNVYHTRYLALSCQTQHNTSFFDDCCHPLLSTESLSSRPSYCTPTAAEDEEEKVLCGSANSTLAFNSTLFGNTTVNGTVVVNTTSTILGEVVIATATSSEIDWCDEITSTSSSAAATVTAQGAINTAPAAATTSTSAAYVAPTTSSKAYVAPTTSTTAYVAPTTSTTAQAVTTTAASSGGGQVMTGGFATYFYQGGNAGACGVYHSDSDYVIAIDSNGWWSNYQTSGSSLCGKSITITNTNNGKTVTAVVADVCPTCVSNNSLDLSVGAFQAIASESDGMVPITWVWA